MPKELVISAAPHETRVAILEDGQLCEIYIEREKEFALVGSIYKGRVTRVLPGMQSAFVDIGLDSDAFLYVGDFLENLEDYDHVVAPVEGKVEKMEQQGGEVFAPPANGGASEQGTSSRDQFRSAESAPLEHAPRSRQVRLKFRGTWSSPRLPLAKRLVRRCPLHDRNAGQAALDKGVTIRAAEAEADAGGKAGEVKARATVIKDAICRPRNTLRRVRIRRRVASLVRNCRPTTSQSSCRASP
jgi:Ribonuclease G/E